MKQVTLRMTVNGKPFNRKERSLRAAIRKVTRASRLAASQVSNVTISCRRA